MKTKFGLITLLVLGLLLFGIGAAASAWSQSNQNTTASQATVNTKKAGRSAGGDVGSGAGDIGKGAAKGAGNLAVGTGKGAVDLVTLHPIDAAGSVGKGAAYGGKDVVVGTTKGTGKIAKGVGKGIKHIF
jgi:hypothetical protein